MTQQIIDKYKNIELNKEIDYIINRYSDSELISNKHKDLTSLKTYTIDDIDTIEIDDAISLEKTNANYKLWIHIASPASYIKYGSTIDLKARKLISSIYLSTQSIYMLPEILINKVLSLNEKENREALSIGVIFNDDGSVFSSEIVNTHIKPYYRLSYDDADLLIDYAPKEDDDLFIISKLLEKRKCWRKKQGAIEIIESHGKIIVNNNIPILKIIEPTISRLLVSEAMILYGDIMSKYTSNNKIPVPYRVQDVKDKLGIDTSNYEDNDIFKNYLLKKNMAKTYYSVLPLKHNSLGLNSYLHATSPIRRYSDLLVHYQISRYLSKKTLISHKIIEKNINRINNIGKQNILRYRDDQNYWLKKWFQKNNFNEYSVILLNWVNINKAICILYFVDYNISSICLLKTKIQPHIGQRFNTKNITDNYNDILIFN